MFLDEVNFRLFFDRLLAKSNCLLCSQPLRNGELICDGCHSDLPWLQHSCQQCAEPLHGITSSTGLSPICGQCLRKPPKFDRTLAPMSYEFPVNFLISQLKHQAKPDLLQLCCDLFLHRFKTEISQQPPQLIIPVPLHRNRLYDRGYNQAAEWARHLSQQLDIPFDQTICKRITATPHQQGLSAKQRRRNLKNAFKVEHQQLLSHVAIVDDVMTTGTTLDLLAHELRKSGITRIDAWCLARTPSHR